MARIDSFETSNKIACWAALTRGVVVLALLAALPGCRKSQKGIPPTVPSIKNDGGTATVTTRPSVLVPRVALPPGAIARLGTLAGIEPGLMNVVASSKGDRIYTAAKNGISEWDAKLGVPIRQWQMAGTTPALALNPSGTHLISGVANTAEFLLWTVARPDAAQVKKGGDAIKFVCFLDDQNFVITYGAAWQLWQVNGDAPLASGAGKENITALACGNFKDHSAWALGDVAGRIAIFPGSKPVQPEAEWMVDQGVESLDLAADGKMCAAGLRDGRLAVMSDPSTPPRFTAAHDGQVTTVNVSASGQIWTTGGDAWFRLWNADLILAKEVTGIEGLSTQALTLVGETGWAVSYGPFRGAKGSESGRFWLWNLQTGDLADPDRHTAGLTAISFAPKTAIIATASEDRTIRLWSSDQGKYLGIITNFEGAVSSLGFSRDGNVFAAAGADAHIFLGNGAELKPGAKITMDMSSNFAPVGGRVNSLAVSPDGSQILTGDETGRIWSWDVAQKAKLTAHDRGAFTSVSHVAYNHKGDVAAATGSENFTLVFSPRSNKELQRLVAEGAVSQYDVAFSPDDSRMAVAGDDGNVRLWDTASWKLAATLKVSDGAVRTISFSPDGKSLAVGGNDHVVRVFDLDGKNLATFEGHEAAVTSIAFSPDGSQLASASMDSNALLWAVTEASTP